MNSLSQTDIDKEMLAKEPKPMGKVLFLLVARSLPIESGGTMIVLRRLLENFEAGEAFILGRTPHKTKVLNDVNLPVVQVEIPTPQVKGYKLWMILSVIPGFLIGLRLIRKNNIPVLIGVHPDSGSLLLSYLLHKATKLPYMVYFSDLYADNYRPTWWERKLATWLQKCVLESAQLIAVNAAVQKFFKQKYGKDSLLIPTAINQSAPVFDGIPEYDGQKFIIGYSGSIVIDRLDPMQDFVEAIRELTWVELRLFTPQSQEYLLKNKLLADNVKVKFCGSFQELMNELSACHLLYLPLTFQTQYNSYEQLSTCFGIKTYEYLLACRPVLVHCPLDYFTSYFFEDNKCGYRIGNMKPVEIAAYLQEVRSGYNVLAPQLAENGLKTIEQFKGETLAKRLREAIFSLLASEKKTKPHKSFDFVNHRD